MNNAPLTEDRIYFITDHMDGMVEDTLKASLPNTYMYGLYKT